MIKGLVRTTIRIDNNLKTRIELLAVKNKELTVSDLYKKLGSDITNYKRNSVI